MIPYLKNLSQLHFLVVKDGMDTVNSLLGLVRCSPLGFLMQDGNQSPDGHRRTDIRTSCTKKMIHFIQSKYVSMANAPSVDSSPSGDFSSSLFSCLNANILHLEMVSLIHSLFRNYLSLWQLLTEYNHNITTTEIKNRHLRSDCCQIQCTLFELNSFT